MVKTVCMVDFSNRDGFKPVPICLNAFGYPFQWIIISKISFMPKIPPRPDESAKFHEAKGTFHKIENV